MALCQMADVEATLLRSLTEDEARFVDALIDRASGLIVDEVGPIEVAERTIEITRRGVTKVLLQGPVVEVASVDIDGDAVTDWTLQGRRLVLPYRSTETVEVVYTSGFATIPATVAAVCAELVAGHFRRASIETAVETAVVDGGTVSARTVEGYSEQLVTARPSDLLKSGPAEMTLSREQVLRVRAAVGQGDAFSIQT